MERFRLTSPSGFGNLSAPSVKGHRLDGDRVAGAERDRADRNVARFPWLHGLAPVA